MMTMEDPYVSSFDGLGPKPEPKYITMTPLEVERLLPFAIEDLKEAMVRPAHNIPPRRHPVPGEAGPGLRSQRRASIEAA